MAINLVASLATYQEIVSSASINMVHSVSAFYNVIVPAAPKGIGARATLDDVDSGPAVDLIIPVTPLDQIITTFAVDIIRAAIAKQTVSFRRARNGVISAAAVDLYRSGAGSKVVVAITAIKNHSSSGTSHNRVISFVAIRD